MGRVYSTESGRICPHCDRSLALCGCSKAKGSRNKLHDDKATANFPNDGVVRITRESKGRKGAGVTIVHGIQAEEKRLKDIAKSLKQLCGCGGAVKQGSIEIQGDHREKIKNWLDAKGFKSKLAGG